MLIVTDYADLHYFIKEVTENSTALMAVNTIRMKIH